jgi:hypothetical protein
MLNAFELSPVLGGHWQQIRVLHLYLLLDSQDARVHNEKEGGLLELVVHNFSLSKVLDHHIAEKHVEPNIVPLAEDGSHGFLLDELCYALVSGLPVVFLQTKEVLVFNLNQN